MNYEFRPTHIEHYCADYPGQMKEEDPKPVRIEGLTVITEDLWHFGGRCFTRKELERIGYFYVPIAPGSDYVSVRIPGRLVRGSNWYALRFRRMMRYSGLAHATRSGYGTCTIGGEPATWEERLEIANLFAMWADDAAQGVGDRMFHGLQAFTDPPPQVGVVDDD